MTEQEYFSNRTTIGNGVTTTYTYNYANLAASVTSKNSSGTIAQNNYTYYDNGNVAGKTDNNGRTVSYTYDNKNRLTKEVDTGKTTAYTFDARGNRSTMTVSGTESSVTKYTYDSCSRLTKESTTADGETEIKKYYLISTKIFIRRKFNFLPNKADLFLNYRME